MPWSILLEDETLPVAAPAIGRLLQRLLGGVAFDHVRRLNTEFGWIARGLTSDQADALLDMLRQEGHPALKKDEAALLGEPQLVRIRRALPLDDALHVETGLLGELQPVPWSSLALVSAGIVRMVKQQVVKHTTRKVTLNKGMLAMGIPMPSVKTVTKTGTEQVVDEGLVLQLAFPEENLLREIRPHAFDYSYLGERLQPTGSANFVQLLHDLRQRAGAATWTAMARELEETGARPHAFQSDRELLRYTRWILEKTFWVEEPPA